MGFGSAPFGAFSFGSWGAGDLAVVSAKQYALNAVDVTFSVPVQAFDPATIWDALDPDNWSLSGFSPFGLHEPLVRSVVRISSTVVRVLLDSDLTQFGQYEITVGPLVRSETGITIDPDGRDAFFTTFAPPRVVHPVTSLGSAPVQPADIANPQVQGDAPSPTAPLATFQITNQGDYGNERGAPYLRKRILRRATTAINEFLLLPGYGFLEGIKTTVRPDKLRRIRARALAQIGQEPGVSNLSVSVEQQLVEGQTLVFMRIKATDVSGQPIVMTVPLTPGG